MSENDLNMSNKGHTYIQWIVAIIANATLMTHTMQTGWISPYVKVLQSEESPIGVSLSETEMSWVASSLCISAAASILPSAYISDKYGRKICILLLYLFSALGWLITMLSTSTAALITARVFCGLAGGACYNIVPIYIKEISQDNIRGALGSLMVVFGNLGLLTIYLLGAYFDYYTTLWIVIWFPISMGLLMLTAPESPAYMVKIGDLEKATSTIAFLRGLKANDKSVLEEIKMLRNEHEQYSALPEISNLAIFKNKRWLRSFIVATALVTAQAYSGVFTILTYASPVLSSLNVTISPDLLTLNIPIVMIVGSFICMYCVEKLGRRPLFIASSLVVLVSMTTIGTLFILQRTVSTPSWLPVVTIVVATFGYSTGLSSIPYVILAEMFNYQIRAKVVGYIVTYAWMLSFVQLGVYSAMNATFGNYSPFFLYCCLNLLGIYVSLVFLPETRGKSVEEIEEAMNKK